MKDMVIDSNLTFDLQKIREIVRDCYLHPDSVKTFPRSGMKYAVARALAHLWFAKQIRVLCDVFTNAIIREMMMLDATPFEVTASLKSLRNNPGTGYSRHLAKLIFINVLIAECFAEMMVNFGMSKEGADSLLRLFMENTEIEFGDEEALYDFQ